MFSGFSDQTADFFWGLALNNNRAWFLEHKEEFEAVLNQPFRALAAETLALMQARFPAMDLQAHIARIYRDARRTYGRGPYKGELWFTLQPGQRHPLGPLFWFSIDGTSWSCGAGYWDCPPEQAAFFRAKVDAETARFEAIVRDLDARGEYHLWGDLYKRPKGERGPLLNPWYNRKHISCGYEHAYDALLYSPELPQALTETFAGLMPLYQFLLEAYQAYVQAQAEQHGLARSGDSFDF